LVSRVILTVSHFVFRSSGLIGDAICARMAGLGLFYCCYCRRAFLHREELISHVLSHYKDERDEQLSLLQNNHHPNTPITRTPTYVDAGTSPSESEASFSAFPTVVEPRPPPPLLDRSEAILSTSPVMPVVPGVVAPGNHPQPSFSKDVLSAADQKYQCATCGKYFKYSHHFKAHKRIHEGEGHFSCEHCGKVFSQTAHLIRHKRIHTGERPFACELCTKSFNQSSHLIRHKRVHTGERPFVCDHCHKSFSQSAHLMKHRRVHSGERPFPCEDCNKKFTQHVNLLKHRKTHHGVSGEAEQLLQDALLDTSGLNDDFDEEDYGSPVGEDLKAASPLGVGAL
ncbi:unnamed protein product, partial [Notodromas monacha]